MKTMDRYILVTTLNATLIVLGVLLGLFGMLLFADELGRTKGGYGTSEALRFVAMGMPRLAYQVLPPAAMLGTLMGLGALASHSELTAMRASGLTMWGLLRPLTVLAGLLMLAMFITGEFIAPKLDREADLMKTLAKQNRVALSGPRGMWLKSDNTFIQLRSINSRGEFESVRLYVVDPLRGITQISSARTMYHRPPLEWVLNDYRNISIEAASGVQLSEQEKYQLYGLLSPELVELLAVKPHVMSVFALSEYVDYLEDNNVDSYVYQLSFWTKMLAPLAIPVMVLLAVPFVIGSTRTISVGHRILLGTLFGLVFHIAGQAVNYVALVQHISPVLSALAPVLVFLLIAGMRFRKVF